MVSSGTADPAPPGVGVGVGGGGRRLVKLFVTAIDDEDDDELT